MQKIHFGASTGLLLEAMKKLSQEPHRNKYDCCPKRTLKAKGYFKLRQKKLPKPKQQQQQQQQQQQNPKPMMPFRAGKTNLVLLVCASLDVLSTEIIKTKVIWKF